MTAGSIQSPILPTTLVGVHKCIPRESGLHSEGLNTPSLAFNTSFEPAGGGCNKVSSSKNKNKKKKETMNPEKVPCV